MNTAYNYDVMSRLISVLHQSGSTILDGDSYTYDGAGNRISKTPQPGTTTYSFGYDPIYELLQATRSSDGSTTEKYSYDAVGNRLTSPGAPYSYNTSNELTAREGVPYTYDNDGNRLTKGSGTSVTSFAWDFENRLSSVTLPGSGGTNTFKYDPFGRRVYKSAPSGTTIYVYDGANTTEELNGSGTIVERYTYGAGTDEPLVGQRQPLIFYYEADGLGSVTSLTDSTGAVAATYTYDSFGFMTNSTGSATNALRYTARHFDSATGLYYDRARYYDPIAGRFISEDPIGFDAGPNFYSYTLNNPLRFADPLGTDVWLEGPSGNEPYLHLSINVGDPNGNYDSYSFGVNGDARLGGEVYKDTSLGGEIQAGYYLKTTPDEDARVKALLDAQLGNKAPYRPWRTCRNFSEDQFNKIKAMGIGTPTAAPPRTPAPGGNPTILGTTTSTSAWDWLNIKTIFSSNSSSH